mmetsp:Transcript_23777/g.68493  ORF Transcript_23777/g.68493 Transcript_23777/m.68493 type:complete len:231 (-) Transcript_23777:39-731(-)
MQSTHFVPDEIAEQHGLREPVSLPAHAKFADDVMGYRGRPPMQVRDVVGEARSVVFCWRTVLAQFRGRRKRLGLVLWCIEAAVIVALVVASCVEMWWECPLEADALPTCRHCYGGRLAVWGIAFAALWSLHLQLSVLMASQGFCFCPRRADDVMPGVPAAAIRRFVYLSAFVVFGLALGAALLLGCMGSCRPALSGGKIAPFRPRSELMVVATGGAVVGAPLLLLGRALF